MSEADLSPAADQEAGTFRPFDGGATGDVELAIEGMHCESCVALVTEVLEDQAGVRSAAVDLGSATAVVRFDPAVIGVEDLRAAIAEAGYSAAPAG